MATEHKTYELTVEHRHLAGKKNRQLRRQQVIPAVVYGYNVNPESVQVSLKELERVYLRAGNNSLVDLRIGDNGGARKVFIHNVQRDPRTHVLTHVDFMAVNLRQEMTASVPLVLTGESPIVRRNEGLLMHALDHLQVRALPTEIPPSIEVDISGLEEVGQTIHVSDITLPEGVTLLTSEEELVAKVTDLPVEEVEEVEEAPEAEGEEGAADEGGDADTEGGDES